MDRQNTTQITNGSISSLNNQVIDIQSIDLCCSKTPFFMIKYSVLVTVSLLILIFCIIQIILNPADANTIYFSLIAHILGVFIPSPKK